MSSLKMSMRDDGKLDVYENGKLVKKGVSFDEYRDMLRKLICKSDSKNNKK